MTKITPDFLEPYFHRNKTHAMYKHTVDMYDSLRIHADGEYPAKLIDERRPGERDEIKLYRKQIYEPVTKDVPNRILSSLSKIRRSEDWGIKFDDKVPASISKDETPEKYFEQKFPYFNSITNWCFSVLLRQYLLDANAVVLVLPTNKELISNEYLKPYPYIFNSPDVIDYVPQDYAILRMPHEHEETLPVGVTYKYKYLVVTALSVQTYAITGDKYVMVNEYIHGLNYLPIADIQAVYKKNCGLRPIFESQIYSIVPHLNKAVREDSDLDGVIVQHAHPKFWEYASAQCGHCADKSTGISTGFVNGKKGKVTCPKCHGNKNVETSPYSNKVIRSAKTNMGEQATPTPPMGFVELSPAAMEFLNNRIQAHLFSALASKNMQFLMQTPLNISGDAKALDKDELNNTVHAVAEDLVSILDRVIVIGIDYRYMKAVKNPNERKKLRPTIPVPETFDLLGSDYLMEELAKAKTGNVNKTIIYGLEKEFIDKKFNSDEETKNELTCILELDPMPYLTEDEKMVRLQNEGITKVDYIISCNIVSFVTRAEEEIEGFYELEYKDKRAKMEVYAQGVIDANSAKAEILSETGGG